MIKHKIKAVMVAAISVCILVAAQILAQLVAMLFAMIHVPEWICFMISGLLYIAFTYFFLKLILEKRFKYQLADLRITLRGIRWYYLAVSILVIGIVYGTAILLLKGHFGVNPYTEPYAWILDENQFVSIKLSTIVYMLFQVSIGGAIVEEMIFRGAMLGVLEKDFGKTFALVVPSVLFGLVHLLNGSISLLSAIQLVISGSLVALALSLVVIKSGSIVNSILFHILWNGIQVIICISDTDVFGGSMFLYRLESTNQLLTGGDYGFECSIISVFGYLLLIAFVLWINRDETSEKTA